MHFQGLRLIIATTNFAFVYSRKPQKDAVSIELAFRER